jgi:phosphohistidine swiveling domain-containing protein
MKKVGKGSVTSGSGCRGVLHKVESVADVMRLLREDMSDAILLTPTASATIMTPLFPRIKGVVCSSGGATSHVAIVAREFDLCCVMGVEWDHDGQLDGCAVDINAQGEIFVQA